MTEHERWEREAWLRDRAIAASRNGIIVTDPNQPDNPIVYVSSGFERITGYTAEEVLGFNCRFLQGEDRDQQALKDLRAAIREERECRVVLRNYKKDGTFFWNDLSISVVRDEEGRLVNFVGVQDDITERKFYEDALRESEARYRTLYDNNTSMYFTLDARGTILSVNRFGAEQLGYAPEELVGTMVLDIFREEDRAGVSQRLEECLRDPAQTGGWEARKVRKDGRTLWVQEHVRVVRSPEGESVVLVVCEDITERKRAEREIEIRTHQQAVVAELGLRALAASDLRVLMDEAVAALARTLNVECCEVLELLPDGSALLLRAGVGWREGLVGEATVGVGSDSQAGYTLLSGEPVIVEDADAEVRFGGSPLLREHGVASGVSIPIYGRERPFGVLGAHATSRRSFTEDDVNFLQAVANVLATVVERKAAGEALREVRGAERQRMARDLHDEALQDLIHAMQAIRDTSAKSEAPELQAELEKEVETLQRAILGLRGAIYDLRLNEEREQTFVEMLESLVELSRQGSPESEIELAVEEGFAPPLDRTGQVQLLRIVQEALANVRRHSGARHVRVALGASGGRLWAEVSDDGRGLAPGTAGTGIKGMHERARALGGELKVTSEPGGGTTVLFEVALAGGRGEPETARILLVEDHASFREAAASVFEKEPEFTVVGQAGSLEEARAMLGSSHKVDVAVVDLALPDGYGAELIRELCVANPQAQALVLSASLDRMEVARAVESGAAGVLHKSAGMDEVVKAVRRLRAGETLLPLEEVVELLRFAGSQREQEYEAQQAITQLTPREKEVLRALAEGLDVEEIAERLHISTKTERNHVASIFAKLGVHSRLQALVFALRHGVVDIH